MEPFSKRIQSDSEEDVNSNSTTKLFIRRESLSGGAKQSIPWKRWLLICTIVCVTVVGAAFLFVAYKTNESQRKREAKTNPKQGSRVSYMSDSHTMTSRPSNDTWIGSTTLADSFELQNNMELPSKNLVTTTLAVKNGGPYGKWFTSQFCKEGTFANGFNMKYHHRNGTGGDNTALNAISLQCADINGVQQIGHRLVQSAAGHRGHWTGDVFCPRGKDEPLFLEKFALNVQPKKQTGDDTMANEIKFSCRDLNWIHHSHNLVNPIAGVEGKYGKWSKKCPKGTAICGLQTRIEGHLSKGDNTALNDVRFFCCDWMKK